MNASCSKTSERIFSWAFIYFILIFADIEAEISDFRGKLCCFLALFSFLPAAAHVCRVLADGIGVLVVY